MGTARLAFSNLANLSLISTDSHCTWIPKCLGDPDTYADSFSVAWTIPSTSVKALVAITSTTTMVQKAGRHRDKSKDHVGVLMERIMAAWRGIFASRSLSSLLGTPVARRIQCESCRIPTCPSTKHRQAINRQVFVLVSESHSSLWNSMIFCVHSSLPSIRIRDVFIKGAFLALCRVKVFAIRSLRYRIIVPEQTPCSQLWKQKLNHVLEGLREKSIRLRGVSMMPSHG